jgi:hypothetical protein
VTAIVLAICWWGYGVLAAFCWIWALGAGPGGIAAFVVAHALIGLGRWPHQTWLLPLAIPIGSLIFALGSGWELSDATVTEGAAFFVGACVAAAAGLWLGGNVTKRDPAAC